MGVHNAHMFCGRAEYPENVENLCASTASFRYQRPTGCTRAPRNKPVRDRRVYKHGTLAYQNCSNGSDDQHLVRPQRDLVTPR